MTEKSIDIVTTGLIRPELLDLTYKSFLNGISNLPPVRIIINIDPLGGSSANESIAVVRKYCNNPIIRTPETPNFMAALKWCWSQVESDYFIHLEDDWLLNRRIDFNEWRASLGDNNTAQSVLLMKKPEKYIYSFRPHLAKSSVCQLATELPINGNPEKEISHLIAQAALKSVVYGDPYCVTDTGRKWANYKGLKKTEQEDSWFNKTSTSVFRRLEFGLLMSIWHLRAQRIRDKAIKQ